VLTSWVSPNYLKVKHFQEQMTLLIETVTNGKIMYMLQVKQNNLAVNRDHYSNQRQINYEEQGGSRSL